MLTNPDRTAGVQEIRQEDLGERGQSSMLLAAAAIVVAVVALRVIALKFNATDLFFDEAQYWFWSTEPSLGYYSKPPLIGWIIATATSVCGDTPFCIRLPSAILHGLTALVLFFVGSRLYGNRTGYWSALVYATLPAVSVSSGIISTDVPLLACFALALYAFVVLVMDRSVWWPAVLLGLALGLGLNAKYAMAYFVLSAFVYGALVPQRRWIFTDPRLWTGIGIGLALIVPNLIWNLENGFATLSHTADNANWQGRLGNPDEAFEFLGAQFGVFGPILFGGLIAICFRAWRHGLSDADALLLSFALPVLAIVTTQAFISRAHANWAAVSYISATVLLTATMIRRRERRWFAASMTLHVMLACAVVFGAAFAGRFVLPGGADPLARTLGWKELAEVVRDVSQTAGADGRPISTVIADGRAMAAELTYYLRDTGIRTVAWRGDAPARDHYQLVRPYAGERSDPVLLATLSDRVRPAIAKHFREVEKLASQDVPAGKKKSRRVTVFLLSGWMPAGR